jgi:hypothetical protein
MLVKIIFKGMEGNYATSVLLINIDKNRMIQHYEL